MNRVIEAVELLDQTQVTLPASVKSGDEHWFTKVYLANLLKKEALYEPAYWLLREVYEENQFHYDKSIHAGYEDYIQEKVQFFVDLAALNMLVTQKAACSIPYLDEALIMLDAAESVKPYISAKEIKQLKEQYRSQV